MFVIADRSDGALDVMEDGAVEFREEGEDGPYDDAGGESIELDPCPTKGIVY
jgi:hypothetical protein